MSQSVYVYVKQKKKSPRFLNKYDNLDELSKKINVDKEKIIDIAKKEGTTGNLVLSFRDNRRLYSYPQETRRDFAGIDGPLMKERKCLVCDRKFLTPPQIRTCPNCAHNKRSKRRFDDFYNYS